MSHRLLLYVKNYYPHFSVYQDHTMAWLDK